MKAKIIITGPGLYDDNALININNLCEVLTNNFGLEFSLLNDNTIDCEFEEINQAVRLLIDFVLVPSSRDLYTRTFLKKINVDCSKLELERE